MSGTNAPQPSATGPAEVFDSPIAPPNGPAISRTGGPGPDTSEAFQGSGAINSFDPYLNTQFIIHTTVTWTTTMDPGTVIYSLPIHPSTMHQWMAHLNKMYNVWDGGFDFAIKIAGTGFHAGALLIFRLPPNIKPSQINTPQHASAFEYKIMDPKTLEVEIDAVIDQRRMKYHYNPLDVKKPDSFGGYLVIMVNMPLATSSTGNTQIAVQVLVRPSMNFRFAQLRPIDPVIISSTDPTDLINALNFTRGRKHSTQANETLTEMTVWTPKSKKELTFETANAIKFNKDPMNGYFYEPLDAAFLVENKKDWRSREMKFKKVGEGDGWKLGENFLLYFNEVKWNGTTAPPLLGISQMTILFTTKNKKMFAFTYVGNIQKVDKSDPPPYNSYKYMIQMVSYTEAATLGYWQDDTGATEKVPIETELIPDKIEDYSLDIIFHPASFKADFDYTVYAPSIQESIITFKSNSTDVVQPLELREELNSGAYGGIMQPTEALVFELIDTNVDLPILPVKLHYDGYFTSVLVTADTVYKLQDGRYKFQYVGRVNRSDPLIKNKGTATLASYARNMAISRMQDSSLRKL